MGVPLIEIFYSPISPLFPFLVQIHMLSNDICCLSNDPIRGANETDLQKLDFCLHQPNSKPTFYIPPSKSQETTNSVLFDYNIGQNIIMMKNRLM